MKHKKYRKTNSFHIRIFLIFLFLTAHYAIIIFHWKLIIEFSTDRGFFFVAVLYLLLIGLISKTRIASYFRYVYKKSWIDSFGRIGRISLYLVLFFLAAGLSIKIVSWIPILLKTTYWERSHWFWVSLIIFIVFGIGAMVMWEKNLISWKMLQDLKTIPLVSPIFCFGAPVLWTKNLAYASLDPNLISVYSTLSVLAGVIFLAYLTVFGVLNHKFANRVEPNFSVILSADGTPVSADPKNDTIATNICFSLFGIGLYIFVVVLVDVLVHLSA